MNTRVFKMLLVTVLGLSASAVQLRAQVRVNDNLGNHTATKDLNINQNNVTGIGALNYFVAGTDISDISTGGNIGDAASTVNKYTVFQVRQTTTGKTLTLPAPTNTLGRKAYVKNTGTTSFTMYGVTVATGSIVELFYNGAGWTVVNTDSAGFTLPINRLAAATGAGGIDNGANAQTWNWNSLAGGTGLSLESTSTVAASATQTLFNVALSGANATASQTTYGAKISNAHTGSTSTNVGLKVSAGGGTTANYALQASIGGAQTANTTSGLFSNTATSSTASINKIGVDIQSTGTWNGTSANNTGLNVNVAGGTNNYAALFSGGNVGIGTTSPQRKLDITNGAGRDASAAIISGDENNNAILYLGTPSGGDVSIAMKTAIIAQGTGGWSRAKLHFALNDQAAATGIPDGNVTTYTAGVSDAKMTIQSNGYVGIGTTSPSNSLSFNGTAARTIGMERDTAFVVSPGGKVLTLAAGGAKSGVTDRNGGDLALKSGISTGTGTSAIRLYTAPAGSAGTGDNAPTEKMTILGNGNVGIGTIAPNYGLDIAAKNALTDNYLRVAGPAFNQGYSGVALTENGSFGFVLRNDDANDKLLIDYTSDMSVFTNSMTFDHSGNVGIGTTAPAAKLDVKGQVNITQASGSNYVGLVAPAANLSSYTLALPTSGGSSGQVLTTSGGTNPTLSWASPAASTVSVVSTETLVSSGLTGTAQDATDLSNSIILGQYAGYKSSSISNTNLIGDGAGYGTKSSYSTFIGHNAGMEMGVPPTDPEYKPVLGDNNIIIGTGITLPQATSNGMNLGGVLFGKDMYDGRNNGISTDVAAVAGKIGIATNNPKATLDVNGTANILGSLHLAGSTDGFGLLIERSTDIASAHPGLHIGVDRNTDLDDSAGLLLTINAGNAYNETSNIPGGDLLLKSGVSTGNQSSAIHLYTATPGDGGTTKNESTEKMTIQGNGNVGIGSTTPQAKLDIENNLPSNVSQQVDALHVNCVGSTDVNSTAAIFSNKATVVSQHSSADWQQKVGVSIESTGQWGIRGSYNTGLLVNVSGAEVNNAAIFRGGNVGIGTPDNDIPSATLDVVGTANVSGVLSTSGYSFPSAIPSSNGMTLIGNKDGSTNWRTQPFPQAGTGISISGVGGDNLYTITNTGVFSIKGTTNQIKVNTNYTNTQTGDITLSLPQDIELNSEPSFKNLSLNGLFQGSVLFIGNETGLVSQNNGNFFWDNTNNRLGIGTTSPQAKLDVSAPGLLESFGNGIAATGGTPASGAVSSIGSNLRLTGTSTGRIVGQGPSLTFAFPASTNGSNVWEQARILATPANTNNNDARGRLYLQVRDYSAQGVSPTDWNWRTGLMINNDGNVGIGTTAPGEALDVRGNLRVGGANNNNYIAFRGTTFDGDGTFDHTYIGERIYGGSEKSELLLFKGNNTDATDAGPDRIRLLAGEMRFDTYDNPLTTGNTATNGTFSAMGFLGTNRMTISSNGNVGIGTSTPAYLLDVNGSGKFNNLYLPTGIRQANVLYQSADGSLQKASKLLWDENLQRLRLGGLLDDAINYYKEYSMLIGEGAPGQKGSIYIRAYTSRSITIAPHAQVPAEVYFDNTYSAGGKEAAIGVGWEQPGSTVVNGKPGWTRDFFIWSPAGDGLRMSCTTGQVQIPNLNTSAYAASSDVRLKKSINTIDNALEKVLALRGVTYNWRKDEFPRMLLDDKIHMGFIAQEVEKIIPEMVVTSSDGFKGIEYNGFGALLTNAMQELYAKMQTENTQLRQELDDTKKRLKAIEEKLGM